MPPDLLLPLSPRVARPIVRVISLIYRHHLSVVVPVNLVVAQVHVQYRTSSWNGEPSRRHRHILSKLNPSENWL